MIFPGSIAQSKGAYPSTISPWNISSPLSVLKTSVPIVNPSYPADGVLNVTSTRLEQFLKALLPIEFTELPIYTFSRFFHCRSSSLSLAWNTPSSMVVIELSVMTSDLAAVFNFGSLKHPEAIPTTLVFPTLAGISNSPSHLLISPEVPSLFGLMTQDVNIPVLSMHNR